MTLVIGVNSHHSALGKSFRVIQRAVAKRVPQMIGTRKAPKARPNSYSLMGEI